MAQITTRAQIGTAIASALDDVYTNRGTELKPIYTKFLKKQTLDKGQWIDYDMAYFGKHVKKGELEGVTYDDVTFNVTRTTTPDSYALGYRISREALDDLAAGGYGVDTGKIASLSTLAEKMRDSATQTQEYLAAQLVISASSSTASSIWVGAGRDGVALAGTHTLLKNGAGTAVNLMTAASLNYYQLQSALTNLETIPSDEGFYSTLPNKVTLVVGPYNRHRAYELVKTAKKPDTNENNESSLNDFTIDVVVNPNVGSTFKGFLLLDPSRHKCRAYERQAPIFEKEMDFEAKGMKVSSFMRFKVDFSSYFGTIYNAGA